MTAPVNPVVTICVPVFNGERFLEQCLDSLLSQTYRDFVLLISDNASTDSTSQICQRYVQLDSRVKYHRNSTNIGLYGNFNFLLRSVRTRYVKLASADDFWAPTMLDDALAVMERDPSLALCYPKAILVDQDGKEIRRYEDSLHMMDDDPVVRFKSALTEVRLVNQLMGVIRTDVVRSMLPLMSQAPADCVFLAEITLYGKVMQLPEYHYFRRFHPDATSWDRGSESHQIRRLHGAGTKHVRFATWKYHWGLFRRLFRSPIAWGRKLLLVRFLGRRVVWDRSTLINECLKCFSPSRKPQSLDQREAS